jgi:hypothetical protein
VDCLVSLKARHFANHPYLCKSLTKIKQQNQSNLALPVLVAGYLDYDVNAGIFDDIGNGIAGAADDE